MTRYTGIRIDMVKELLEDLYAFLDHAALAIEIAEYNTASAALPLPAVTISGSVDGTAPPPSVDHSKSVPRGFFTVQSLAIDGLRLSFQPLTAISSQRDSPHGTVGPLSGADRCAVYLLAALRPASSSSEASKFSSFGFLSGDSVPAQRYDVRLTPVALPQEPLLALSFNQERRFRTWAEAGAMISSKPVDPSRTPLLRLLRKIYTGHAATQMLTSFVTETCASEPMSSIENVLLISCTDSRLRVSCGILPSTKLDVRCRRTDSVVLNTRSALLDAERVDNAALIATLRRQWRQWRQTVLSRLVTVINSGFRSTFRLGDRNSGPMFTITMDPEGSDGQMTREQELFQRYFVERVNSDHSPLSAIEAFQYLCTLPEQTRHAISALFSAELYMSQPRYGSGRPGTKSPSQTPLLNVTGDATYGNNRFRALSVDWVTRTDTPSRGSASQAQAPIKLERRTSVEDPSGASISPFRTSVTDMNTPSGSFGWQDGSMDPGSAVPMDDSTLSTEPNGSSNYMGGGSLQDAAAGVSSPPMSSSQPMLGDLNDMSGMTDGTVLLDSFTADSTMSIGATTGALATGISTESTLSNGNGNDGFLMGTVRDLSPQFPLQTGPSPTVGAFNGSVVPGYDRSGSRGGSLTPDVMAGALLSSPGHRALPSLHVRLCLTLPPRVSAQYEQSEAGEFLLVSLMVTDDASTCMFFCPLAFDLSRHQVWLWFRSIVAPAAGAPTAILRRRLFKPFPLPLPRERFPSGRSFVEAVLRCLQQLTYPELLAKMEAVMKAPLDTQSVLDGTKLASVPVAMES